METLDKQLQMHTDWKNVDIDKVKTLLETSFGAKLRQDYFDDKVSTILLEPSYHAIAVTRTLDEGLVYIDKLAVMPQASYQGLGTHLLNCAGIPKFWRCACHRTPSIQWYSKKLAQSHHPTLHKDTGIWTVFGIGNFNHQDAIQYAHQRISDFY